MEREKSTMLKAVLGEITVDGTCELGHNVKVGYFAQNQAALLDPDLTVFQTVDEVAKGEVRTQIRNMLGRFMFSGEDIDKKVKNSLRRGAHAFSNGQTAP